MIRPENCMDCDECQYVGDGEYVCMLPIPEIIIKDFGAPTDFYQRCKKRNLVTEGRSIHFTINLKGGATYAHWYYVPAEVLLQGTDAIEKFLLLEAYGDKVWIDIDEGDKQNDNIQR